MGWKESLFGVLNSPTRCRVDARCEEPHNSPRHVLRGIAPTGDRNMEQTKPFGMSLLMNATDAILYESSGQMPRQNTAALA